MAHNNTIDPRLLTRNVHSEELVNDCLMSSHDHVDKIIRLECTSYTTGEGDHTRCLNNAPKFHVMESHFFNGDTAFQTTSGYPFESQSARLPLSCLPQRLDSTSSISALDQVTTHPVRWPHNYPAETHYDGCSHQKSPQLISHPSSGSTIELSSEQCHNELSLQTQSCTICTSLLALHDSQQGFGMQPKSNAFSNPLVGDINICSQDELSNFSRYHLSSFRFPDIMEDDKHSHRETGPLAFPELDILHSSTWTSGSMIPPALSLHNPSEIVASVANNVHMSTANITNQSNWGPNSTNNEYTLPGTGNMQATLPFTAPSLWDAVSVPENLDIPEKSQILNDMTYLEDMTQLQHKTQEPIWPTGIPSNTLNQFQTPIQTPQTGVSTKPFGPSRPISLPPARRGGRKGPLSVEELRKRRESRKQVSLLDANNSRNQKMITK